MTYFAALVVDGALAGALYALLALSFVIVYRASRMLNFAVGEWVMLAARFVTFGLHALGLGLPGALVAGCAGMAAVGVAFNGVVLRRLVGQPLISVIMVTLGLGALVRGASALAFADVPTRISVPGLADPLVIAGVAVAADKLVAAIVAAACTALVACLLHGSRTGVALRAIADDQQAAMSAGIDLHRHFAITWALAGIVSVLAGTLWTVVAGGGLGIILVGLRVFPIVIIGGARQHPRHGRRRPRGGRAREPRGRLSRSAARRRLQQHRVVPGAAGGAVRAALWAVRTAGRAARVGVTRTVRPGCELRTRRRTARRRRRAAAAGRTRRPVRRRFAAPTRARRDHARCPGLPTGSRRDQRGGPRPFAGLPTAATSAPAAHRGRRRSRTSTAVARPAWRPDGRGPRCSGRDRDLARTRRRSRRGTVRALERSTERSGPSRGTARSGRRPARRRRR